MSCWHSPARRTAQAGVVEVRQCRGAGNDLIDSRPVGGFIGFSGCADGGEAALLSTGGAGASAPIAFRNMTFTAPGDTTFAGGRIDRQMNEYLWYAGSGAASWAFGYLLTDAQGTTLESCGFSGAVSMGNCFTNTSFLTVFPADHVDLPAADSRVVHADGRMREGRRLSPLVREPGGRRDRRDAARP